VAYNDNQVDDLIEIRTGDETDSDGAVDSVDVDDAARAVNLRLGPTDRLQLASALALFANPAPLKSQPDDEQDQKGHVAHLQYRIFNRGQDRITHG